jgi:hypothetical protein
LLVYSKVFLQLSRDFIDIYLLEMRKGTKNFDQEQLELVCLDLFKVRLICPAVRVCLPGSAQGKSLSTWTYSREKLTCLDLFKVGACLPGHFQGRACLSETIEGKSLSTWTYGIQGIIRTCLSEPEFLKIFK